MRRAVPLIAVIVATMAVSAQPQFRAAIEVIAIDVSVMRDGRPVQGLTARDFLLTDNGTVQEVESITLEQLPLTVTLVVDVSQSVDGSRLGQLIKAGNGLSHALRADDQAALITFAHQVTLRVPMTTDMELLRAGLKDLVGIGSTSLRDAVHLAIQLRPLDRSRSLILVFSDGEDTASWLSEADVITTVRRNAAVTHVVRLQPNAFLDKLADASGGRTWSASSDSQLQVLFTRALEEMRSRYLLTYSPRNVEAPGWHEVNVRVRNRRADITARPGYFVNTPQ